jgi:hypothetical protein
MKQLLEVPCYLVIYADSNCMQQIKELRNLLGLNNITRYVEIEFTELPKYKYIDVIKMNRENYHPTKDERTCAESHLICCSKFELVLNTINLNPFNTSKFGWIDANVGINFSKICVNYKDNMLIDILNNCNNKFHLQILNVCDKKYINNENLHEYYNQYRWVVCGCFFTTGKEIGIKILNDLNNKFIETTSLGYGHGEEMFYLEILDEFYDDIERSYGDYKHILNNYITTTEGLDYIYHFIIKNYLNFGYYRECYDCCKKMIEAIENNKYNIDYSLYIEILFSLYLSSYYYKSDETLNIINYIYELYNNNNLFKIEFDKNKHFYESQFKYSNVFKNNYKLIINIFACATVEKYKNEILKINETWGKVAEELGVKVIFFLGEEETDLKDDTKYVYLKGVKNDYNSASYKQNLGLKYIYENYSADFILTCGTDTYLNIKKLLVFIETFDKNKNLYIGGHGDYRFVNKNTYYHSGCGFLITNNILSSIYSKLYKIQDEWTEICKNNKVDYLISSCDVLIGYYLSFMDVETITNNDAFKACNHKGLAFNNTFICCQNKIKINEIICCHNMNLTDFDEYTKLLELNNYYLKTNILYYDINMDIIKQTYTSLCNTPSDINEHLPTLYKYASQCDSVLELGVRGCVSSWAFLYGLLNNNNNIKRKLILNDIEICDIDKLLQTSKNLDINISYKWINDLDLDITESVDITFIDTWHVYGQLKRELDKFSKITNKYIIMHDTTVDGIMGETIRNNWNASEQSIISGFPIEEINCGLQKAIDEFLYSNDNWKLKEKFTKNNGLTILEKNT